VGESEIRGSPHLEAPDSAFPFTSSKEHQTVSDFYEPKTQKGLFGNVSAWVIGATILALVVGGIVVAAQTVFANPAGQAGAYREKVSATNRVQQQAKFEQLAADYDGYLVQIKNAEAAVKSASPETQPMRETDLLGLRQICVTTAQDFNAESRKYLARDWKSAGLPERLDPAACQATATP
jgi:hypothetical protein